MPFIPAQLSLGVPVGYSPGERLAKDISPALPTQGERLVKAKLLISHSRRTLSEGGVRPVLLLLLHPRITGGERKAYTVRVPGGCTATVGRTWGECGERPGNSGANARRRC